MLMNVNDVSVRLFFCVFNLVWVTIFIEAWKRESSSLAYKWGTSGSEKFEECRAAHYGELSKYYMSQQSAKFHKFVREISLLNLVCFLEENPVTGRLEPHYPKHKRALKFYLVSVPIILLCVAGAVLLMFLYFYFQDIVNR